jgi:hypothetical protein
MPNVSLANEDFLQKEFVESKIFEILNPQLYFLEFLPKVQVDAKSVAYKYEDTSASTDPKKRKLRDLTPGAKFAKVTISDLKVGSAIISREGVEIRIDEDAQQYKEGVDEMDRAFRRAAYYLAESTNTKILNAVVAGITTSTTYFDPSVEWSDPSAKPITDLVNIAHDLKREGYPYKLTDVYIHSNEYFDLLKYLTEVDISGEKQRTLFGVPNVQEPTVTIPVLGNAAIHSLDSSITTQDIIVFDRNFPAGTYYYAVNPKYPMEVENEIGFHVNKYDDDETHDAVFQLWIDSSIAIKEPYAAIYNDGSSAKPI